MGDPKCTNHQPRLFGGISPPSIKMLPFSPRAGYTGVRRAWGTEILALKCCCRCCCRAWRAATKAFSPLFNPGKCSFRLAELGSGGTWGRRAAHQPGALGLGTCIPAPTRIPEAALPAANHFGCRFSTALCSLSAKQAPPLLLAFGFMPPNLGSHALGSLWPWVLVLRPCWADAGQGCSSNGATA